MMTASSAAACARRDGDQSCRPACATRWPALAGAIGTSVPAAWERAGLRRAALCLALLGLAECDTERVAAPEPAVPEPTVPAPEPESLAPESEPVVPPAVEATEPSAHMSVREALGRSRADVEAAWGEPIAPGRFEDYGQGRMIRYRSNTAIEVRAWERRRGAVGRAEWLGISDELVMTCTRNRDGWCELELPDVAVEVRAGVFRLWLRGSTEAR